MQGMSNRIDSQGKEENHYPPFGSHNFSRGTVAEGTGTSGGNDRLWLPPHLLGGKHDAEIEAKVAAAKVKAQEAQKARDEVSVRWETLQTEQCDLLSRYEGDLDSLDTGEGLGRGAPKTAN